MVVIYNAHDMTDSAQNVQAKNLEEPPEGVHFVLTCETPQQLLATIALGPLCWKCLPHTIQSLMPLKSARSTSQLSRTSRQTDVKNYILHKTYLRIGGNKSCIASLAIGILR